MTPSLIALIVFIAATAAVATVLLVVRDIVLGVASHRGSSSLQLRRLPLARDDRPPQGLIGQFDYWLVHLVRDAGYEWSPMTAFLYLMFGGVALGALFFVWNTNPLTSTIGVIAGMAIGLMILMLYRNRRVRQLQEQLPVALDMLARAVRAGESLDQAVQLVGEKSPEPLAKEFRRTSRQLDMGLSMPAVMRSLVNRVRLIDVRIFTTTLTVHRKTGGNLAWTLERLAAVIRERLAYQRQMRAATSAGRLSATIITLVGPLLFTYLFFFQPQYIEGLLRDPIGQSLLAVAVFLEVIGLIWVTRMLRTGR